MRYRLEEHGLSSMILCDSAGTHGYHIGEAPDQRSIHFARNRGVDMSNLRARKVSAQDFHDFDLILGLDGDHVDILQRMAPANSKAKLDLFLNYAGMGETDVPDPYYGDEKGFEHVLDLVERGVGNIIEKWKQNAGK